VTGTLSTSSLATLNSSRVVNNLDVSGNTNMTGTCDKFSCSMNSAKVVNNLDISGNSNISGALSVDGYANITGPLSFKCPCYFE
jgi:hypothetical protein